MWTPTPAPKVVIHASIHASCHPDMPQAPATCQAQLQPGIQQGIWWTRTPALFRPCIPPSSLGLLPLGTSQASPPRAPQVPSCFGSQRQGLHQASLGRPPLGKA